MYWIIEGEYRVNAEGEQQWHNSRLHHHFYVIQKIRMRDGSHQNRTGRYGRTSITEVDAAHDHRCRNYFVNAPAAGQGDKDDPYSARYAERRAQGIG